jgi:hypothetical protein
VAVRRVTVSILIAVALAGAAVAIARRGAMRLPPLLRLQDFEEQIASASKEFNAIGEEIPSTLALMRDRGDEPARQTYIREVQRLTERGNAGLARLRGVTTPDPALRTMVASLVKAQVCQIAWIEAARRYLETGKVEELNGTKGFLDEERNTNQCVREFMEQKNRYLTEHNVGTRSAAPQP